MLPGHTLRDRYKIIKQLGSGSFGITYLAEDLDLPDHPLCVVKNLRQSQDPEEFQAFIAFFNKEAKALYRLGNELNQIPRLFAHFQQGGEFYLVQEYIDGHDLSQEIFPGNKLNEAQVTQLLNEILEVLTIIHHKNIIHRDIKPQNLMRRKSDGKIILIDFGTIKEIQLKINSQEQTNVSVIAGTNGYMPSEQFNGYPKLASDVYAVGMLGIYALTGIRPQELPKNPETFEVIWQDKASVSPKLANLLDKMVRSNFKERYQSAGEAMQGLTKLSSITSLANHNFLIGVGALVSLVFGIGLLFMTCSKQLTTNTNVQLACSETDLQSFLTKEPEVDNQDHRYYGEIKNRKYHGCGILIFSKSGNKYQGQFQEGQFHGQGTFLFSKTGDTYIGQFKNSLYEGIGKYIYNNGCQYIGEFKNNMFDGQGTCISQDGSRENTIWYEGKSLDNRKTCCN
ncbi:protein kinase [Plectonema cf. radiosum LEGE 06105]|uniref:non-specific serine/threonine protein kinase n=1 Tax=Plectonema cf. radiosum LEGE 06105 TaxID=945769 RepID=A0A8J7F4Q2_9CYAN|nr:protein kinase [Plectonema radiosum]MBE9215055.1 protein kinase [Plectonema cf. radiosum LEGE 06105]